MLFVQFLLIDKPGFHSGPGLGNAMAGAMVEGAVGRVELMELAQGVGHDVDLGRLVDGGRQQVHPRHCA
ncbi:hypothetical protein D3C76_969780 [compost metagenome]